MARIWGPKLLARGVRIFVEQFLNSFSGDPARVADQAAKVATNELGILVRKYVSLDVAEGGLRFLVDAIVERLDNLFFEVGCARILRDNSVSNLVGLLRIGKAEHVHLDTSGHECHNGMHVLRDARRRVESNCRPHSVKILLRDTPRL